MSKTRAWMVRAGNENEIIDVFLNNSVVAIGWSEMGDIGNLEDREEVKEKYEEKNPEDKKWRKGVNSGQMFRFAHKIKKGDYVLTYDKSSRDIHIGKIESKYKYRLGEDLPDLLKDKYPHMREVEWLGKFSRDDFSTPAKNSLGSLLTVFNLDEYITEIESLLEGERPPEAEEKEEESPPFHEDVEAKSEELISDLISKIDPHDFEQLVAAVLEAMGYYTKVSDPGPDKGIDIIAHPDSLGFESPLIKVQVKQRKSSTGRPEMQQFSGTVRNGEKALFVSTGGFTKGAEEVARNSTPRISLLDRDGFIDLLLKNYEKIDSEEKTLLPLKKIYVPLEE